MSEYRNWGEWERACRMNIHERTDDEDRDDDGAARARDRAERVQQEALSPAVAPGATEE